MSDPEPAHVRRVSIIRNPVARRAPSDAALAVPLEALRGAGWIATVQDTTARGDATALASAAAAGGADVVVVSGGDGTLNEAVNGLASTDTALAVIRGGTANVWAREVGISRNPTVALGLIGAGRRIRVDTGVVQIGKDQPRHFLLMCSAGLDVEAVQAVEQHPRIKRWMGRAAFGWPAIRAVAGGAPVEAIITVDDPDVTSGQTSSRATPLLMAIAGNTRLYGSVDRLADEALIGDGMLDLVTFEDVRGGLGRRAAHRARLLGRTLRGHLRSAGVVGIRYARVRRLEVELHGSLPVQIDGEFIGVAGPEAPLRLWSAPGSLTVIVPAGGNPLFGQGGAG